MTKRSFRRIAGIDEVGRGALAGPVAAAAVLIKSKTVPKSLGAVSVRDSKKMTVRQREEIFEIVKQEPDIEFKVSFVWPQVIDRVNINQATQLAWKRCFKKLNPCPDFVFLDGNQEMSNVNIKQKAVIKGDQKIFLISLASIAAKVSRDRLMEKLHRKYPEYEFGRHKGYGTRLHLERLKKFGPCLIHRRSYRPVFDNLPFQDKVYYAVSQIPKGQVMTYKEVAQTIGHPNSYRAVGNTLNRNVNSLVPCHRVIRSDGQIGGFNAGGSIKKKMLEKERIK